MTNRFRFHTKDNTSMIYDTENEVYYFCIDLNDICDLLNALHEENLKLKSENNMLRTTIGRNEAYIDGLTHKSEWSNKSQELDEEYLHPKKGDEKISMKKLLLMQEFLEKLNLSSTFSPDGDKLYLLNSEDKILEIQNKCNELGVTYVQERKAQYAPIDPNTLERPIVGFIITEWFEVRE